MTYYAIRIHLHFLMAVYTHIHIQFYRWFLNWLDAFPHLSMATDAFYLTANYMPLVREIDMSWFSRNFNPWYIFLLIGIFTYLLFLWALCNRFFMACPTDINIRDTCKDAVF